MILGFTGTSKGMTRRQLETIWYFLNTLGLSRIHHGDCIGADAEVDEMAKVLKIRRTVHPPLVENRRAFCQAELILAPLSYLNRDWEIAKAGVDGLIATPRSYIECLHSGTWTTVRYARRLHRHVWVVVPDGTWRFEENLNLIGDY